MPPNVTEKNPESKRRCFAHHFLTFEEYGLWVHAREVSAASGIFYFNGPAVAARFADQSKNTPYRIAAGLVKKGFFHVLKKAKRDKKTGIFRSTQYQPVSFEEWAEKYPARYTACKVCKSQNTIPENKDGTIPEFGNGASESVPEFGNDRPQTREQPSLNSGSNSYKEESKEEKESKKTTRAQGARKTAAPQTGLAQPENRLRVSQTILRTLTNAGKRGASTVELAVATYGREDSRARDLVVQAVGALRRKGLSILLAGNDQFSRRYVLQKDGTIPSESESASTTAKQIHLLSEADAHGWSQQELKAFLKNEFGVTAASHLTHLEYLRALRFVQESVPLPPGLRNPKVQ
jgi:hypothetical protein